MPAIAALWEEAVRAAFAPLLPPDHPLPSRHDAEPRLHQGLTQPDVRLAVEERDGRVLGSAGFGASRDPDAPDDTAELRTLFVHPSDWRAGVGSALVGHVRDECRGMGFEEVTVWSFAANDRANAFYDRHGFGADGEQRREETWAGILEIRLRRGL